MDDQARQFLEVKNGLNSPFWKFVRSYLLEQAAQVSELGVQLVPSNQSESIEREQLFGKAKALRELVDQIPNTIDEKMNQLEGDK
jgi:hypothetical protein